MGWGEFRSLKLDLPPTQALLFLQAPCQAQDGCGHIWHGLEGQESRNACFCILATKQPLSPMSIYWQQA